MNREQLRRLRSLPTPEPEPSPLEISDDNTSIYQKNDRRVYTCAVCRTRESESWWKAPRNLPTNSLCDDCGIQWRKYAIKSARGTDKEKEYLSRIQQHTTGTPDPPSTRSGAAGKQGQPSDKLKREGTPLVPPALKKAKARALVTLLFISLWTNAGCQRYCNSAEAGMLSMSETRSAGAGCQMYEVWLHGSRGYDSISSPSSHP